MLRKLLLSILLSSAIIAVFFLLDSVANNQGLPNMLLSILVAFSDVIYAVAAVIIGAIYLIQKPPNPFLAIFSTTFLMFLLATTYVMADPPSMADFVSRSYVQYDLIALALMVVVLIIRQVKAQKNAGPR
jgi:hypothetical protein